MSGHLCDKRDMSQELCLGSNEPGLLPPVPHPITYPAYSFRVLRLIHWLIYFVPTSFMISRPFSILILSIHPPPSPLYFVFLFISLLCSRVENNGIHLTAHAILPINFSGAKEPRVCFSTWLRTNRYMRYLFSQ